MFKTNARARFFVWPRFTALAMFAWWIALARCFLRGHDLITAKPHVEQSSEYEPLTVPRGQWSTWCVTCEEKAKERWRQEREITTRWRSIQGAVRDVARTNHHDAS